MVSIIPIVQSTELETWENYTSKDNAASKWILTSIQLDSQSTRKDIIHPLSYKNTEIFGKVWKNDEQTGSILTAPFDSASAYYPFWQQAPPPFDSKEIINLDVASGYPALSNLIKASEKSRIPALGLADPRDNVIKAAINNTDFMRHHNMLVEVDGADHQDENNANAQTDIERVYDRPHSWATVPIFKEVNDPKSDIVGFVNALVP